MDLTGDEQHVRRASVGSEVTLALWDVNCFVLGTSHGSYGGRAARPSCLCRL